MNEYKSPYRRGAENGLWFGLYLTALFFASAWSLESSLWSMMSLVLMTGVIPVTYFVLRRTYLLESRTTTLSSLWMQGIMTFMCGSLIAGVVSVVYMKWLNPGYLYQAVEVAIGAYRQTGDPQLDQVADGLQMMVDAGALPSPASLVFASIWTAVLTGSILSLILGLVVRARNNVKNELRRRAGQ